MLNQLVLVGRLVSDLQINETENGKKECNITLSIPRNYKNEDGIYENDYISLRLCNEIATKVVEYCKKGDLVGVKGHIQTRKYEDANEVIHNVTEVIAEKVTFLSSKKAD